MQKENILIVGASGFVGKALTRSMLETNSKVFLTSRDKSFKIKGAKVFYGDLNDIVFCKKILKNIDVVYYLASYKKNIAVHTKIPFEVLAKNVTPLITFLEAVKVSKVKKIVYTSSSIVEYFSLTDNVVDGYVYGKYINESIIKSFVSENKTPITIVRSAAVYGPGNDFNPDTANLIPSLIIKAIEAKDEMVLWGKGTRRLQFIYIDDLVHNLIAVKDRKEETITVGNPMPVSIKKVLQIILAQLDKKLKISHDLTKPDKKTQLTKFNNIVKPKIDLKEGIMRTLEFYIQKDA